MLVKVPNQKQLYQRCSHVMLVTGSVSIFSLNRCFSFSIVALCRLSCYGCYGFLNGVCCSPFFFFTDAQLQSDGLRLSQSSDQHIELA